MGASVRDYFVIKAEAKEDFVKEEIDDPFCGDGFLSGAENHPLSKPMVDHDQKRVEAVGEGKVGDKITGDLLERAGGSRANGGEGRNSGMCVEFILLTNGASLNIFAHEGSEAKLPEFGGHQLVGFQIARMTSHFMVMALDEDGLSEGWVRGHIDMALVGEDPLGILPIKWMRAKGGRNEAIY